MRRLALPLFFLICIFPAAAFVNGQTPTLVTGTVTDINSIPYSNARVTAQLIPSTASPTIIANGIPTQIGGLNAASADVNGNFTMNLFCNSAGGGCSVISPAGTQWQFTVTTTGVLQPWGTGPQACSATVTITGASQSISATFSACPALTRAPTLTGIPGNGTVTTFSASNFLPLFNTSVATPSTTPALSFSFLNAGANTIFGNCTGVSAPPAYCAITPAMLPAGSSVTSVGLSLPGQFSVSGSPVTSTGTLAGKWNPVPANYYLGGPQQNSIGGIFDGGVGTTGNSTSPSATIAPTTSHDWAFAVFQSTGQAGLPTMPGAWTSTVTNGNQAAVFRQELVTNAAVTAPVTLTTSATWAEILFSLRLPGGSPTIVQTQFTGGAFSTATNTFPGNTVTGNSILAVFCAPATSTVASVKFSDALGNIYTQMASSQNGTTQEVCAAALTATIVGGTTDPVTVVATNTSGNSFFWTAEISNIATATAEPVFEPILASALQNAPTVNVFSNVALGANVTINNTNTPVATRTVTMPSTGCPCRAFLSYSLSIDFAGVTNQPNIDFWVSDSVNSMAGVQTGQSNAQTGGKTSATYGGYSTVTYGNSATVTFTLIGIQPGTAGAVVQAAPATGSGPNSSFQVAISTSN